MAKKTKKVKKAENVEKTIKEESIIEEEKVEPARGRGKKRPKRKRIDAKKICIIVVAILALIVCGYFLISRIMLFNNYSYEVSEQYQDVIDGLKVKKTIVVAKKTEKNYETLKAGPLTIKDDFKDYSFDKGEVSEETAKLLPYRFVKKVNDKVVSSISFGSTLETLSLIAQFASDVSIMLSNDKSGNTETKYNLVDKKAFLEKNNIKTDVDLYQFIVDNYPLKTSFFDSEEKLKEAYAFNTFVDVVIPAYNGATLIKGDYTGIVFDYKAKIVEVHIYKNGKRYGFLTNDERFHDEEFLKEMISTIEIDEE